MTWIPRSRVGRWVEWNVVVPLRKVRNRIGCAFGRHFAWNQYFHVYGEGRYWGEPTGVAFCVSCDVHRCVYCSGEGKCGACEPIRQSKTVRWLKTDPKPNKRTGDKAPPAIVGYP